MGDGSWETEWDQAKKGRGRELRVAFGKSKSLWEKRGSAWVGETSGEIRVPSMPMLSSSATVE